MVILKRWKDSNDWFIADYVESMNLLYSSNYISEKETLEALKQGSTLQTVSAWYKRK